VIGGYNKAIEKHKEDIKMSAVNIGIHNFENEVMESEKKVLLDFWAPWCGPCRMVSPIVDQIAEETTDFAVGKVNVDEEPELASRFGVMSIPTLVVVKGGQVVRQEVGAKPKPQIVAMVQSYL
jgi:thioredoxin 1